MKTSFNQNIRVMYLNPVGTSAYDQTFADMAKTYKYAATSVDITSMNPGSVPPKMTNLEYRTYESFIIKDTVEAARYCSFHNYQAMVIGCFYDPALQEAREISGSTIIIAPCQASIEIALNLGNKFSIIVGETKWIDQMEQTVYNYGYRDQLASFEPVGLRVEDFHKDPEKTKALLEAAAKKAITVHNAEVIILGCTLEIGFYSELQSYLLKEFNSKIPVIDPSIAALKAAENAALLVQNGWTNSRVNGMQPPPEAELKEFGMLQTEYVFGNKINVPATSS